MPALIPMLNSEECQEILKKIEDLRPYWLKRQDNFYTLGAALYLDQADGNSFYNQNATLFNEFLRIHFSHLYNQLLDTLKKELKEDVLYEPDLALPGFHIFLASPEFVQKGGKIHFDLQFMQAACWYKYKQVNYTKPLSFTLALALPRLGGGLYYWDKMYDPIHPISPVEAVQDMPRHYLEYESGKMALHDGFLVHQIAPGKEYFPEDRRITLQGHALHCDGAWRVYW